MRSRRFAGFLLGIWLGCELLLGWVAIANSRSANRALAGAQAGAAADARPLGSGLGPALRYQAEEQTRGLLEDWGLAQIALGGFLLLFLLFATEERQGALALALFMFALSAGERVFLTPEIVARGRTLDFVAAGARIAERIKLSTLGNMYLGMEALKWAAGLLLAGKLTLRTRARSGYVRRQVDVVDKANHSHVNR
jgi:hypothetical protein